MMIAVSKMRKSLTHFHERFSLCLTSRYTDIAYKTSKISKIM